MRQLDRSARIAVMIGVMACLLGVAATARVLQQLPSSSEHRPMPVSQVAPEAPGSRQVRTSFGVLAVHAPTLTRGLTARSLAGNVHGIQDYVPPERQLVKVPVTLHNDSGIPAHVISSQFYLATRRPGARRDARLLPIASSSLRTVHLESGVSVEGEVGFVVPRDGTRLILGFRDAQGTVLRIPIGSGGPVHRTTAGDHVDHTPRAHGKHEH